LYAKSFVYIFRNNHLINKSRAKQLNEFLNQEEADINLYSAQNKSIITSFIGQNSVLPGVTFGLTFLMAEIAIMDFLCNKNYAFIGTFPLSSNLIGGLVAQANSSSFFISSIMLIGGFSIGFALQKIAYYSYSIKRGIYLYHCKKASHKKKFIHYIFYRNSKIIEDKTKKEEYNGRFSMFYYIKLLLDRCWYKLKYWRYIIPIMGVIFIIIIVFCLCWEALYCLKAVPVL
jgi:hypothetical protein